MGRRGYGASGRRRTPPKRGGPGGRARNAHSGRGGRRGVSTTAPRRSSMGGMGRSSAARSRSMPSRNAAAPIGMNGPGSVHRTLANITKDGLAITGKYVTPQTWIDTAKIYNQILKNAGFGPNRFGYTDFRGHFTPGQLKHNGALGSQNQEH